MFYKKKKKSLIDSNPLRIIFDKKDGFIRLCDGTRFLVLLVIAKYDSIYDKIRYIISVKSGSTYVFSHNYASIKVNSYDSLPLEKTMTLCNVIMLVESVFTEIYF